MINMDAHYMRKALELAEEAAARDEVPVGALVVMDDKIIAKGYNQVELLRDATAHAEMLALSSAFTYLNSKFASDCTLYVTLEPCLMCTGALYWSRISRLVYGASDPNLTTESSYATQGLLHPKTLVTSGVLEAECAAVLQDYFRKKR